MLFFFSEREEIERGLSFKPIFLSTETVAVHSLCIHVSGAVVNHVKWCIMAMV